MPFETDNIFILSPAQVTLLKRAILQLDENFTHEFIYIKDPVTKELDLTVTERTNGWGEPTGKRVHVKESS
jgi:hypothetical protein